MRISRTWEDWKEYLTPVVANEAFEGLEIEPLDIHYEDQEYTANEVFDAIVKYRGGMATGHEIRIVLSQVYGFDF